MPFLRLLEGVPTTNAQPNAPPSSAHSDTIIGGWPIFTEAPLSCSPLVFPALRDPPFPPLEWRGQRGLTCGGSIGKLRSGWAETHVCLWHTVGLQVTATVDGVPFKHAHTSPPASVTISHPLPPFLRSTSPLCLTPNGNDNGLSVGPPLYASRGREGETVGRVLPFLFFPQRCIRTRRARCGLGSWRHSHR